MGGVTRIPTAEFSLWRPRLPGQQHPGLGLLANVVEMFRQVSLRLDLDGVVFRPAHYHVAAVGAQRGWFLDPEVQGLFDALRDALADRGLAEASELIDSRRIRGRDGVALSWQPDDFVAPVSPRLRAYFDSPSYQQPRERARRHVAPVTIDPGRK
jgi:hypothetical protein